MRFKTSSGTEYVLKNIETVIEATGEECPAVGPQGIPVRVGYRAELARVGDKPIYDMMTGGSLEVTDDFHTVEFGRMPVVGERFTYSHPVWYGCYSSPVQEITEDEA